MCSLQLSPSQCPSHISVPPPAFLISASCPIPHYSLHRELGAASFPVELKESDFSITSKPYPAIWCQYPRHCLLPDAPKPHQPTSPHFSILATGSCWKREQPRFLDFHSPKELKAIAEHAEYLRDECGAVSAVCTAIHGCSVEEKIGTYGPNYLCPPATNIFLFRYNLSALLGSSAGSPSSPEEHNHMQMLFIRWANYFCNHIFPTSPASCPIPKVRVVICDCERRLGTFWKVKSRVLARCQLW